MSLYREVNYRSLVVVAETVFLISFKLVFSLNWFKNLLCLENWQHKHSVIFRNVFIAYLTIAVVPSKRLTDANSVKGSIPYIGPKFMPAFHSAGMQKCLSVNLFEYGCYQPGQPFALQVEGHLDFSVLCFYFSSVMAACASVLPAHGHICAGRFGWPCFNLRVTLSDLDERPVPLSAQACSTSFPSYKRNSIGRQGRV